MAFTSRDIRRTVNKLTCNDLDCGVPPFQLLFMPGTILTRHATRGFCMTRLLVLALGCLLCSTQILLAQDPEWILKVPLYQRLKWGPTSFSVDQTRNTVLFNGGAYDTYATDDSGKSWRGVWDSKMFFIDDWPRWCIDGRGRWYYVARLYQYFNMSLASDDGGRTIRYLLPDSTSLGRRLDYVESTPYYIPPDALVFDATSRDAKRIYITTDAGRSFSNIIPITTLPFGEMRFKPIQSHVFGILDSDGGALEVDTRTGVVHRVDISSSDRYVRLRDSTVVQVRQEYVQVRKPGSTSFTELRSYVDPATDSVRPLRTRKLIQLLNDTMAVIYGRYGEVFTYSVDIGLRVVSAPPARSNFQYVMAAGMFGDRFLVASYIPEGTSSEGLMYSLINVRTGATHVHARTGTTNPTAYTNEPGNEQQIVPLTDSLWLAGLGGGEFLRTTNAGRTWTMVDNIARDPQWGDAWVGISRLFQQPDGSMILITDRDRVMMQASPTSPWEVTLLGPFMHRFLTPGATHAYLNAQRTYREDLGTRYRIRYGPSTLHAPTNDELWASGDAVVRYTRDGAFIDTVLQRRARFIKQVSPNITVAAMDSVYFTFNQGRDWVYVGYQLPSRITARDTARCAIGDMIMLDENTVIAGLRGITMVVDPLEPDEPIDSIPGGLFVSTDKGDTWKRIGFGIDTTAYISALHRTPNGTLLCVASDMRINPWYLDAADGVYRLYDRQRLQGIAFEHFGSSIYRSVDNGVTWSKVFDFGYRPSIGQTDIRFTEMPDGRILAIHPSFGIATSRNDGERWQVADPLNIGTPEINDVIFTPDGYAHLATSEGYVKILIDNIVSVRGNEPPQSKLRAFVLNNGQLRVSSENVIEQIELYAIDGRLMLTTSADSHIVNVPTSQITRGTYIIVAKTDAGLERVLVML